MLGTDRKRIEWIDGARGIAMCMIVFGHCIPGGFLKLLVYSFHVPVFFFLSGFLFHGDQNPDFVSFLKREFEKLMVPYYGAGLLSVVIYLGFGKMASRQLDVAVRDGGFWKQAAGLIYGNCKTGYMKWNLPLWFLPCLFTVSLLAWFLLRGLQKAAIAGKQGIVIQSTAGEQVVAGQPAAGKQEIEERGQTGKQPAAAKIQFLILFGIICFLILFGICLTDRWKVAMLPLGGETAVRMLPFFLAGTGVGRLMQEKQKNAGTLSISRKDLTLPLEENRPDRGHFPDDKVILWAVSLVGLAVCTLCTRQNGLVLYHRDEYGQELLFYLGAVSGICLVLATGMIVEKVRWIGYIGRHTMVILLFHKFPILFFQVLVPPVGKLLGESSQIAGILVSGFAILSCLILEKAAKSEIIEKAAKSKVTLDKRKGM